MLSRNVLVGGVKDNGSWIAVVSCLTKHFTLITEWIIDFNVLIPSISPVELVGHPVPCNAIYIERMEIRSIVLISNCL